MTPLKNTKKLQPNFVASISKEELTELPRAIYPGSIRVIDRRGKQYNEAIKKLKSAFILGIDTESKPTFVAHQESRAALLQIALGQEECFLFRLNRLGLPEGLRHILSDPEILKIGLSLSDDVKVLRRLEKFDTRGFVELQRICPAYGIQDLSLQKIYGIICHGYMSKSQRMTNWEAESLTEAQQAYAAMDAYAPLEIYQILMEYQVPHPHKFALL